MFLQNRKIITIENCLMCVLVCVFVCMHTSVYVIDVRGLIQSYFLRQGASVNETPEQHFLWTTGPL